jgi:succinate dehydrogenase/fumarate reductase flavoprotein subunit
VAPCMMGSAARHAGGGAHNTTAPAFVAPAHRASTIMVAEPTRCTIQPWLLACGRCQKSSRHGGNFFSTANDRGTKGWRDRRNTRINNTHAYQ